MTLQQISNLVGKSESSIKTNLNRTNESLKNKYGIYIVKTGRGKNVDYYLEGLYENSLAIFLKSH